MLFSLLKEILSSAFHTKQAQPEQYGAPVPPFRLPPSVSIGMAAHGNVETTRAALDTLFTAVEGDYELLLVDDCSPDDICAVYRSARQRHANTRIFRFDANLEYSESVNAILSSATGEYVFFLSNDIFVSPAYFRELLACLARHPSVGIARGCSNFVDNSSPLHNIPAPARFGTPQELFTFAEEISRQYQSEPPEPDRFLVGDAFLVHRKVLDAIGTFDTRFVGYLSDADFGLRAKQAGFGVVLERKAFAFHEGGVNFTYLPEPERQKKLQRRYAKVAQAGKTFFEKWKLSADIPATIHDIPWERLAQQPFDQLRHLPPPKDYTRYLYP